jgi:BlaI family transcriptional regulator, penicillinase repressor
VNTQTPRPTEAELAILDVLWTRGEATVREVYEDLYARDGGGYTNALKLLQVMHGKGLVVRDDSQRAHVFRAAVTRDVARSRLLGPIVQKLFGGRRLDLVLSVLGAGEAPGPEELAEVRALLDRLERERGR